jgi:hypothetical protein
MSTKPPTQADADCITAQTWIASVSADDREFSRRESDALDAGALAYRVIDAFGKSGAHRGQREQALAGAILAFAQKLYAQDRESMKKELDFAKQCERERTDKIRSELVAAAHAAIDTIKIRP